MPAWVLAFLLVLAKGWIVLLVVRKDVN